MGIYSVVFVYRLLDEDFLAVNNVQTFNWCVDFSAGEIVNSFHLSVLTMLVVRNPRGAIFASATRDLLLQALSKLLRFISQQPSCRR